MTNWQQIAEELREAAEQVADIRDRIPIDYDFGHARDTVDYAVSALRRTGEHARWKAEQAGVVNTEAKQ